MNMLLVCYISFSLFLLIIYLIDLNEGITLGSIEHNLFIIVFWPLKCIYHLVEAIIISFKK